LMAFLVLLVAPKKGLLPKVFRKWSFRRNCLLENCLKALWSSHIGPVSIERILKKNLASPRWVHYTLRKLIRQGWAITTSPGFYQLTEDGRKKASYIVRLHRLWELYLSRNFGSAPDKIHHSAEEMEHLITPELEGKLTQVLSNPSKDPHEQPIPSKEIL